MEFEPRKVKAIIITLIAILAIIVMFLVFSIYISKNSLKTNNVDISIGFASIKEIIESNGCRYVKDTYEKNREYPVEVEIGFKYDLYDGDESNEKAYMKLINEIVKFLRYENIKMIDNNKNITIEVICSNGDIDSIIINGIEDYFTYMDSKISLTKFKEIKSITLNPTSEVLRNIVDNQWQSNIEIGSRDSIFNNYYEFFDEGVKYKKIGSKIFNVVFTEKYQGEVIDDVYTTESINSVKSRLGEPAFEDKDLGVIGYKGNSFYAFFNGKEISIYKNITYDYSDFWELINKFTDEEGDMSFKEFMNELTYIWPDYSEYNYDSNYMFISYPNKGIDVKLNYDNESGILVYNNISEDLNRVKRYLEKTELISKLQVDDVFEAEKRRLKIINSLNDRCDEFIEKLKEDGELICGESSLFKFYMDLDENNFAITTYFISRDGQYVNRELNEPVSSYVWISDIYFVYGIYGKGIYLYNVLDGSKQTLIEGNKDFYIKSFEDNILYFDNKEMQLMF